MMAPGLITAVQIAVTLLILIVSFIVLSGKKTCVLIQRKNLTFGFTFLLAFIFVWSVLSLSGVSSFVYFNF